MQSCGLNGILKSMSSLGSKCCHIAPDRPGRAKMGAMLVTSWVGRQGCKGSLAEAVALWKSRIWVMATRESEPSMMSRLLCRGRGSDVPVIGALMLLGDGICIHDEPELAEAAALSVPLGRW